MWPSGVRAIVCLQIVTDITNAVNSGGIQPISHLQCASVTSSNFTPVRAIHR